jgi:hypothetical protein
MSPQPEPRTPNARYFLDRALSAEDKAEKLETELTRLKRALSAAVDLDLDGAVMALSWVNRAEAAEALLAELIECRTVEPNTLPAGWLARAQVQMRVAGIAQSFAGRPRADDYWATIDAPEARDGTRHVVRDNRKRREQ